MSRPTNSSQQVNLKRKLTLSDSLTAYTGMMVTEIAFQSGQIKSIEVFDCGNFKTFIGKSMDSLQKEIRKKQSKKWNIETLLKQAYEKEALSLEQKHCYFKILSDYFEKEVNRISMTDGFITLITVFQEHKMIDIKDAELSLLLSIAKEKKGYDIIPYINKYNQWEAYLLEEWRKFD